MLDLGCFLMILALWTLERVSIIPVFHTIFPQIQSSRSFFLPVALLRRSILQAVEADLPGSLRMSSRVQRFDTSEQVFHRGHVA